MNIIQIGCNNCEDEVKNFVLKNESSINKLLLVDALPSFVDLANKSYYILGDRFKTLNRAISNNSGLQKIWIPRGDHISSHASINKNHLKLHNHSDVESIDVESITINQLMELFNDKVDRLYIDIEGLDVEVLLSLDLFKYKPNYIEYEFTHADGTFRVGKMHETLIHRLVSFGYSLRRSGEYNIIAELK